MKMTSEIKNKFQYQSYKISIHYYKKTYKWYPEDFKCQFDHDKEIFKSIAKDVNVILTKHLGNTKNHKIINKISHCNTFKIMYWAVLTSI